MLPKSRLHIELRARGTYWDWSVPMGKREYLPQIEHIVDPDNPQRHPTVEELQIGPNRYMFRLENHHTLKCELKARLELFGKQETGLPCEPLFCNGDIGTDDAGHRWVAFDKLFNTDEALLAKDKEENHR